LGRVGGPGLRYDGSDARIIAGTGTFVDPGRLRLIRLRLISLLLTPAFKREGLVAAPPDYRACRRDVFIRCAYHMHREAWGRQSPARQSAVGVSSYGGNATPLACLGTRGSSSHVVQRVCLTSSPNHRNYHVRFVGRRSRGQMDRRERHQAEACALHTNSRT